MTIAIPTVGTRISVATFGSPVATAINDHETRLTAAELVTTPGAAAWVTWVPTLTNLTIGAGGTQVAKYWRVGKTIHWRWKFVFGTGSAVGTQPSFTLPFTPHADYAVPYYGMGEGSLLDAGIATRRAFLSMPTTIGTVIVESLNATPTGATVTATAPWTWGTGDSMFASGTYEMA